MKKVEISIIIPVYNAQDMLERCIKSLISQTFTDIEFIFVNDGSTDNSYDILKKYELIDDRIILVNQKNKGVSIARNNGLKYCSGEYIGFVDSDDFVDAEMYFNMYNIVLTQQSDLVISAFSRIFYKEFSKKQMIEYCNYYDIDITSYDVTNLILEKFLVNQEDGFNWNKLYKKSIILENSIIFNKNFMISEDLLFNLEYLKYVKKVSYINKSLYNYVVHSNSASYKLYDNELEIRKFLYKKTMENSKLWKINSLEVLNDINILYSKYPYLICKNELFNRKYNFKQRFKNIRDTLNDEYTKKFIFEINNEDLKVSLRIKIFYKLCNRRFLLYLYLYCINFISFIKI